VVGLFVKHSPEPSERVYQACAARRQLVLLSLSTLIEIGARFIRHGPTRKFLVQPAHSIYKVYSGISEFIVEDELYRQEYTETAIAQFKYQGNRFTEPLVWTNKYGEGQIVGISPGHRIETMKNPKLVTIMEQSLVWLMRNEKNH
jgi:type 1 glutamine amidotransferase